MAATVTFDGTPATNVVVVSDSELTATVPAGTEGPADVTITITGGPFTEHVMWGVSRTPAGGGSTQAMGATRVDDSTLTVRLPTSLAAGDYDLVAVAATSSATASFENQPVGTITVTGA